VPSVVTLTVSPVPPLGLTVVETSVYDALVYPVPPTNEPKLNPVTDLIGLAVPTVATALLAGVAPPSPSPANVIVLPATYPVPGVLADVV
jgi:hypothetical protein